MTVNYIRNLKQIMNNSFENGYKQCSEDILKLIHSLPTISCNQRQYLTRQIWMNHRYLQIIINNSHSSPKLWKPYI